MDGTVTIQVTTEELHAKANTVKTLVATMKSMYDSLSDQVERTSGYWIGDAGDQARTGFRQKKVAVSEMLKRLEEYPVDLEKIAGIYEETEADNTVSSDPLSADVIV